MQDNREKSKDEEDRSENNPGESQEEIEKETLLLVSC